MLDRIPEYAECFGAPEEWAVATIVSVSGSSPSPVGTSMAVSSGLRIIGSLSGGCVESSVAAVAQDAIAAGETRVESFGPDGTPLESRGFGVALTCGGQIEVLIQPLACLEEGMLDRLRGLAGGDPRLPAELSRAVRPASPAGQSAAGQNGADQSAADQVSAGPGLVVREHRQGAPLLFLSGIHDVSVHLARYALQAGWRVQMVDIRPAFGTADRVPEGAQLTVGEPVTVLREQVLSGEPAPWTAVCVMTHHPDLDVPVLDAGLKAGGRIDLLGAMGSRRAAARRSGALRERGHSLAATASVRTPLGLDIQAATPAETAVSMFAELIAARNAGRCAEDGAEGRTEGRLGRPLAGQSGPVNRSRPRSLSIIAEAAV